MGHPATVHRLERGSHDDRAWLCELQRPSRVERISLDPHEVPDGPAQDCLGCLAYIAGASDAEGRPALLLAAAVG